MRREIRHGNNAQIEIYNGDCIAGMRTFIADGCIDVVATSPPYNLGTPYRAYDDTISRVDYLDWMERWAEEVFRILHEDGSLFLNMGAKPSDPSVPFEVLGRMQKVFKLQNVIHWIKSIAIQKEDVGNSPNITGNIGVGHFKPINSPRFLNDCQEYIFHLTKNASVKLDRLAIGVEYQDKTNVSRWKSSGNDRRCRGNAWFVPYKTINSRNKQRPHPATFPTKIPQMCIELHGVSRTRRVLEPFLGIGSTALACIDLGINCTGFELDPGYFSEAIRLIEQRVPSDTRTKS
ncbi:MAG: site-specific DNA-methyltransferase [bacterium]|nr:site-specific DNA-methyltransferase [bacterium]